MRMVFRAGLAALLAGLFLPAGTLSVAAERDAPRDDGYVVERDNTVEKLDGLTGATIWRYPISVSIAGTPQTLVAGRLFFLVAQHDVVALDRRLGHEQWRSQVPSPDFILDAVATSEGLYVRSAVGRGAGDEIQAFDRRGAIRWTSPVPLSGDHFAVLDGVIYVSDHLRRHAGTGLVALDAATGKPRWRMAVSPAPVPATLTLADGVLYARSDRDVLHPDQLVALDERTGLVRWQQPSGDPRIQWGDLRVDDDVLSANATPWTGRRCPWTRSPSRRSPPGRVCGSGARQPTSSCPGSRWSRAG